MATKFLRTRDVAALLGVSPRTIEDWRITGDGPPYSKPPGRRLVLYDASAVESWVRSGGTRRSTSDQGESRA